MEGYKKILQEKMDQFVNGVFDACAGFPREEIYITSSQLKRASLSIVLNYIEGYARFKEKTQLNFLETAYGSLKETKYLLYFSLQRKYLIQERYDMLNKQLEEIGAMLWTEIVSLNKKIVE